MAPSPASVATLVGFVLAAAVGCGDGPSAPPQGDAAAPSADAPAEHHGADVNRALDAVPDAGGWPDVATGTLPACQDVPTQAQEALLAGAFVSLWSTPAPSPSAAPKGTFDADISGVLSVDVPVPTAGAVFQESLNHATNQRFAVEAKDGRRLTVAYEVDHGRGARPLSDVLKALAGKEVSLRFVARQRPEWSLAFVVADREGLAFAFDSGVRGHTLAPNDLAGLSVQPGRPRCSFPARCPGETFLSLQIAAATDVEILPTEQGHFTFASHSYAATNIRHNQPPPGCDDGFFWAAWALWRL